MSIFSSLFGGDKKTVTTTQTPNNPDQGPATSESHSSGGSSSTSGDLGMAHDIYNTYKDMFKPYYQEILDTASRLMPEQEFTTLQEQYARNAELASFSRLAPKYEAATREGLGTYLDTLRQNAPLNQAMVDQGIREIGQRSQELDAAVPTMNKFYEAAAEGIDPDKRAGQAIATVEAQYKGQIGEMSRNAGRLGINPNSGSFKSALKRLGMDKARSKALADVGARERASTESFGRLATGMQMMKQSQPMGGFAQAPGIVSANPMARASNVPFVGFGVNDPLGAAAGLAGSSGSSSSGHSSSSQSQSPSNQGYTTTKTEEGGGGGGLGGFLGTLGGIYLGKKI